MLCANASVIILVCFLTRQRQHFARSLSELGKLVVWTRADRDPLTLNEVLDTRRVDGQAGIDRVAIVAGAKRLMVA